MKDTVYKSYIRPATLYVKHSAWTKGEMEISNKRALCGVQSIDRKSEGLDADYIYIYIIDRFTMENSVRWYGCVEEHTMS